MDINMKFKIIALLIGTSNKSVSPLNTYYNIVVET